MGHVEYGSSEFKEIGRKFQTLIHAVRFANSQFFGNNIKKAYENYCEVEKIMTELDNQKGLGVIWNNKANALMRLEDVADHMRKAQTHFEKAVKNAQEHIDKLSGDQSDKALQAISYYNITLAKRLDNLGHYYFEAGDMTKASEFHSQAVQIHKKYDNKLGEMQALGNLGLVYMELNRPGEAETMFKEAYDVSSAMYAERPTEKSTELLQYASMNMGLHYHRLNQFELARQFLNYALSLSHRISTSVKNNCLVTLIDMYDKYGSPADKALAQKMRKHVGVQGPPKHVHFVLDVSGSMSGSRITRCRESINKIVVQYLGPGDTVSLTTFHSTSRNVFTGLEVIKDQKTITYKIYNETPVGAATLFYDTVGSVVHSTVSNSIANKDQWIVALTDGEDNRSGTYKNRSTDCVKDNLIDMIGVNDINLIVITVDLTDVGEIKKMTSASNNGMHIHARNTTDIEEAFGKVAAIISKGQVHMETL